MRLNDGSYQFSTNKWSVVVSGYGYKNTKTTLQSKTQTQSMSFNVSSSIPLGVSVVLNVPLYIELNICVEPNATNEDIDKLLVLM